MDDYTTQSAGRYASERTRAKRLGSLNECEDERELDALHHALHSATKRVGELVEIASGLADRLFGAEPQTEKETRMCGAGVGTVCSIRDSMTQHHAEIESLKHHIRRLEKL